MEFFFYGTKEADAIEKIIGHEDLSTLRLALRHAATTDFGINKRYEFAVLYRRIGGVAAEVTSLLDVAA